MPAGNRGGRGSRRRSERGRRRSRYLATAAAEQVGGDSGGALPDGRRVAQLGGAGPYRRRRKKTAGEGLVSDDFKTTRAFLQNQL